MGANQSSSTSGAEEAAEVQTSYYELLGIDRLASEDEIKKAYRKKALELHPDRNYGDVDQATKLFAQVVNAYEVLSDTHERAWYDSHEASILRGRHAQRDGGEEEDHYEANIKVTTIDDIAAIISQFSNRTIFDDSSNGFFGGLRVLFEKLAREEEAAAKWGGLDVPDYPSFGHKDDSHDDVKGFYAVWRSFSTRKTSSWKDRYRLSDAEDRWTRRQCAKANKDIRDEAIREFNDAVRMLVKFVHRRDPRYVHDNRTEAQIEKELREASAKQAARSRAANEAKMKQEIPEWATRRESQEDEESGDEDIEEEHFECVACKKTFKSERQYEAHEKSKKHQKAVHALRKKMFKDNKDLNLNGENFSSGGATPASAETDDDAREADEVEEDMVKPTADLHLDEDRLANNKSSDDIDDKESSSGVPANGEETVSPTDEGDKGGDAEYAPRSEVEARLADTDFVDDGESFQPDEPELSEPAPPKIGKAAQKRAKKAVKQGSADQGAKTFKCAVCDESFPSRSRMFEHIKKLDHAAPVPSSGKGSKVKSKRQN